MKFFKEKKVYKVKLFANNIREYRENKGISIRELGRRTGLSATILSKIELGYIPTSEKTAKKVETVLLDL